jgi:hypothetical protein
MIDMPCVDRISLICFGSTDVFSNYLNPFLLQAATVHAVPEPAGLKSSTACAGDDVVHGPWGLGASPPFAGDGTAEGRLSVLCRRRRAPCGTSSCSGCELCLRL